jgi:hypothetical protein
MCEPQEYKVWTRKNVSFTKLDASAPHIIVSPIVKELNMQWMC